MSLAKTTPNNDILRMYLAPHKERLQRKRMMAKPRPTSILPSQPAALSRRRAQSKATLRMTLVGMVFS
jgi:hypothetical protein